MIDVLVIGNVTVDHVLTLDGPPPRGEKAYASALSAYPGGQAANAAYTMACLGLAVRFVGRFGADAAGRESWNVLMEAGCELTGSMFVEDCPHSFAAVMIDSCTGDRSIVTYRDPRISMPQGALVPEGFADVRAFYSDGMEPAATLRGLRLARAAGVMTFADAESTDWLSDGLPWLDELVSPATVLRELASEADQRPDDAPLPSAELLESIARRGPRTVVATAGAAGCAGLASEPAPTLVSVPALDICPVDTTGAGDAFHGGYLAARLRGFPLRQALEFATAAAAVACATWGPRPPMARLRELAHQLTK